MKAFSKILVVVCAGALLGLAACQKDKFIPVTTPPVGLGGDTWIPDTVDHFIYDSLTVPYNVAVNYKWLPGQLDFPTDIVPPDSAKVIPVLAALLNVAYAPYNELTGSTAFMRHYLPKTLELAGSAEYLSNGAILLGQAEGGTAMVIFQVNYFTRLIADSNVFKQSMHTMHHELTHILNQNIMYPVAFNTISTGYTANWYNVYDADARVDGFISAYAEAAPIEDFAEMVSSILVGNVNGPDGGYDNYDQLLIQAGGPGSPGYTAIKAKEAIVATYLQQAYNIDIYALQAICQAHLKNYLQ
jgi:substrate import-associated zinc metallohydrolase lipoprotein